MTQVIARQVLIRQAARRPTTASLSRQVVVGRMARQTLRILGMAVKRAVLAFVDFWNIPVLGAAEAPETR